MPAPITGILSQVRWELKQIQSTYAIPRTIGNVKVAELTGKSPACALLLVAADPEVVESCRASIIRVGIAIFMMASISPIARGFTSATGILGPNLTISRECVASIMAEAEVKALLKTGDAEEC